MFYASNRAVLILIYSGMGQFPLFVRQIDWWKKWLQILHKPNDSVSKAWNNELWVKLPVTHAPGIPKTFSPPPTSKGTVIQLSRHAIVEWMAQGKHWVTKRTSPNTRIYLDISVQNSRCYPCICMIVFNIQRWIVCRNHNQFYNVCQ